MKWNVLFTLLCYFCHLNPKVFVMRKIVFVAIVCLSVVLGACKHSVTTQYTIGCLGYQYGNLNPNGSDWTEHESYLKSNVKYNQLVSFEGNSLSENDKQARQLFNEQWAKIDTAYVCGLLFGSDYFIYGIATLNAGGDYRRIEAKKFTHNGVEDVAD